MFDGGNSIERRTPSIIRHIPCFEKNNICRLIALPAYLGRGCLPKGTTKEQYIKHRKICKLIDTFRYGNYKECCCEENHD